MEKGSSHSSSSSSTGGPHGLQFGKKIYFEGGAPAKKGRSGVVQSVQPPRCQVEGCRVDLSDAKAYYSRHKVCGMHSKHPKVIVAGLEQRFCQQCSRFHLLGEFDQGKRSCRRRLAGHNERRRKPSPGSLLYPPPPPRYANLCPSIFGHNSNSKAEGFVMDFSAYPTYTGGTSSSSSLSEAEAAAAAAAGVGKYQLPWQRFNSQNPLSELVQGTTPPSHGGSCYNNSTSALSLLSNHQPWAPKTRTSSSGLRVNDLLGTAMVQPGATFGCSPWCLKDDQGDSSLHEMPPDLGLGQSSHPNTHYIGLAPQPNEGQFHELDHPRAYDSPVQHMHWLL